MTKDEIASEFERLSCIKPPGSQLTVSHSLVQSKGCVSETATIIASFPCGCLILGSGSTFDVALTNVVAQRDRVHAEAPVHVGSVANPPPIPQLTN
jgi:hypothetical protein